MSEQRNGGDGATRREIIGTGASAVAGLAGVAGCATTGETGTGSTDGSPTDAGRVTVFHAGSLAPPFAATEAQFEADTGLAVTRQAWGSVEATRRVTAQGLRPDVLAVADFRLLRDRVLPAYADWYAVFATNAMVIQYRPDAPGADDVGTDNWWEVLARDDVTLGHADPALDPGGYRALMTIDLGAVLFEGERLYDDRTRRGLRDAARVTTGNEINLASQLRSGKLDYAIYYRSLGETSGLPYVDLQPRVNLSRATPKYARHYASVDVDTDSGTYTGAPIGYGITVPSAAQHPTAGARWVESILGGAGRSHLESKGLEPTTPPVVPAGTERSVPDGVLDDADVRASLGPVPLLSE